MSSTIRNNKQDPRVAQAHLELLRSGAGVGGASGMIEEWRRRLGPDSELSTGGDACNGSHQ